MSFPQSVAIIKKHEMIVASCVKIPFCSFASLVGGTCGLSPENPNVVHFVDSKNSDRDVKAHLRPVYTGDFCHSNSMQFLSQQSRMKFRTCSKPLRYRGDKSH